MTVDGVRIRHGIVDTCVEFLDVAFDPDDLEVEILEIPWTMIVTENEALAKDLLDKPDLLLAHFRRAAAEIIAGSPDDVADSEVDDIAPSIHITELPDGELYDVGQFNPNDVIERQIALRGQVTKRTKRHLRDERTVFECVNCGTKSAVIQEGKGVKFPTECDGCDRERPGWDVNERESTMKDFQEIRLQALPEYTGSTATEQIDIELTGDLVGRVDPGDRAVVSTTIRADRQGESRIRELYGEATGLELMDERHDDIDYDEWIDAIKEEADRDDIFERIVDSIAPSHHGDRLLKMAIALALFGGVQKELPDGSTKRGNSHIIIIGDPGTGKSGLLSYVADLVPRSEFASGKQTSSAGLTATATKDDFGGNSWQLEAGTLVRAHEGVACIDELDKMKPDDRDGMVEAMSEQQISINKAASGTLPAKTTVIAACNPKFGSFDPRKPIGEQLDFHTALLNRFDLWFVLQDEPDEDNDSEVADHMNTNARVGQKIAADEELDEEEKDAADPVIDPEMFRAYVAYARQLHPRFTDDAMERIRENYVELRQANGEDGPIPVTARAVEALHRLSEASARIRLAEEITVDDVDRAINIRDHCLESFGIDPETGELDALRLETGSTATRRDRHEFIMDVVKRLDEGDSDGVPIADVKEECMTAMDESEFESEIETLTKKRDRLCKPRNDTVRPI